MKPIYRLSIVTFLIILWPQIKSYSQEASESSSIWLVETRDGNSFTGSIVNQDSIHLTLMTDIYGTVRIPLAQLKTKKLLENTNLIGGEYWFSNPHATRYFFMTNGYSLRQGEAYYQNTWIMFNQISYGITNHVTIGAGVVPLFLFAGAPTPAWITPKVAIPIVKDKFNVSAGMILGHIIGEGESFGIGYGDFTLGNRDKNLTFGAGWAFAGGEWANSPTLTLSGMTRVGRKTYLLTENYYIGIEGFSLAILSAGGRSVQKRLAVDYGLIFPLSSDLGTFVAVPWLGITIPMGNIEQ
jgi:hypothetical protein